MIDVLRLYSIRFDDDVSDQHALVIDCEIRTRIEYRADVRLIACRPFVK